MRDQRRCLAWLGLAIAIGCVLRLATFTGAIVSDDLTHAWAAVHFWDDPIEHSMPTGDDSAYTVNARRIGVNLPMWIAAEVAGPSEASFAAVPFLFALLGILAIAAWAWILAGPRAGVIAGWLWAVLPIDVWQSTIFLQDNIFATVLAAGMAALAWAERDDRRLGWIAAGLAVGYLQYVKESAVVLLALVVIAGVIRSWRMRRVHRGTLWVIGGAAVVHLLVLGYFAIAMDDAFYYLRAWVTRQVEVEAVVPRPFPHNLVRFGLYLTWGGALGVGLPIATVLGVRWLRRDDVPRALRLQLVVLAIVQLLIVLHVLRWGAWTMRYLMQLTPALVVLGAVGLATAWPTATARARQVLVVVAIATTALGLLIGHPQHGRFRSEVVRDAYAVIARDVDRAVPVYVVASADRPVHYTDRMLVLYDGYRPRTGGWHVTRDVSTIKRGVLVWASYDLRRQRPVNPPGRLLLEKTVFDQFGEQVWIEVRVVGE